MQSWCKKERKHLTFKPGIFLLDKHVLGLTFSENDCVIFEAALTQYLWDCKIGVENWTYIF